MGKWPDVTCNKNGHLSLFAGAVSAETYIGCRRNPYTVRAILYARAALLRSAPQPRKRALSLGEETLHCTKARGCPPRPEPHGIDPCGLG